MADFAGIFGHERLPVLRFHVGKTKADDQQDDSHFDHDDDVVEPCGLVDPNDEQRRHQKHDEDRRNIEDPTGVEDDVVRSLNGKRRPG